MKEMQVFKNEEFGQVRTVTIDGESWFVGKDVAEILGYSNTRDALAKRVDDEDKIDGVAICDPIGREQTPVLINESGLYSLILSSKLPSAKKFKHWVTREVLPSIRKTGTYRNSQLLSAESAGGVARLITVIRSTMKSNGQPPETISRAVLMLCEQFGVELPDGFVRTNPFGQMLLAEPDPMQ
jgi:prophage antirepressor-like protein